MARVWWDRTSNMCAQRDQLINSNLVNLIFNSISPLAHRDDSGWHSEIHCQHLCAREFLSPLHPKIEWAIRHRARETRWETVQQTSWHHKLLSSESAAVYEQNCEHAILSGAHWIGGREERERERRRATLGHSIIFYYAFRDIYLSFVCCETTFDMDGTKVCCFWWYNIIPNTLNTLYTLR